MKYKFDFGFLAVVTMKNAVFWNVIPKFTKVS
jgi:hypothetical protein